MIDASFIDRIVHYAETDVIQANGKDYTSKPVYNPPRPDEPVVEPLEVASLTSICDYLTGALDREQLKGSELILHIESEACVRLWSAIRGETRHRENYILAQCYEDRFFKFNEFMPHMAFCIGLQRQFLDFGDKAKLLQLVGTIRDEQVKTSRDDGVSQFVTAAAGVALNAEVGLPNPVMLKPFRSFSEIDQVPSQFIVRVQPSGKGLPQVALFEADAGAWKAEAMQNVKEFVVTKVSQTGIVILA